MRPLIILGWMAAVTIANAQPISIANTNIAFLYSTNFDSTMNTATQALATFRTLVSPKNFADLGFLSTNEIASASLGNPLIIYKIRLDYLRNYATNVGLSNLYVELNKVTFPVVVGPDVRSALTLAKINGIWSCRSYGGSGLIGLLTKARMKLSAAKSLPLTNFFVLEIPAFNLYFLAHYAGSQLMLTPILDDPVLRISKEITLTAEQVFAALAPAAKKRNDLPG